jgi:hypothetical protein
MTLIGVPPFCHDGREQEPHWAARTLAGLNRFVKSFSCQVFSAFGGTSGTNNGDESTSQRFICAIR